MSDRAPTHDGTPSKFLDTHVLRLGPSAKVASILAIFGFVDVGRAAETLDLIVAPQTLARALSAGYEADALRQRIEAIAPLPESLSRTLAAASVVVGRGSYVASSGFLWVDDANVRELLRTRRSTGELFLEPSPPGGLLVSAQVDLDRLVRRCRTVGVEIVTEGQVVKARAVAPAAPTTSGAHRKEFVVAWDAEGRKAREGQQGLGLRQLSFAPAVIHFRIVSSWAAESALSGGIATPHVGYAEPATSRRERPAFLRASPSGSSSPGRPGRRTARPWRSGSSSSARRRLARCCTRGRCRGSTPSTRDMP